VTVALLLLWLAVGLVAGWLASVALGGGYGATADMGVGIAGAFIGGFLFREFGIGVPFSGMAGTIFIAFSGAVVLLLLLHLLARRRRS
jgi:MYXO-CTERM domain-containing protein